MTMQAPPPGTMFGALPRTDSAYGDGRFPKYEDRFELMPRDKWQPVSLNRHVRTVFGQLDGMCTSNGAAGLVEIDRSFRGRPHVPLSPEHLYGLHSTWGTGSTLGENLEALVNTGVCSREMIPQDKWRPREWPKERIWRPNAAENKVLEFIDCNASFDALVTGLQTDHAGLVGVNWDGDPRSGHAVAVTQYIKEGGRHGIRGPNSWMEEWGEAPGYTDEELAWLEAMGYRPFTGGWYTLWEDECDDFEQFGIWLIGSTAGGDDDGTT